MNNFFKSLVLGIKIIISVFLLYIVFSLYYFNDPLLPDSNYQTKLVATFLVLFFIVLPTLFVFWLKKWILLRYPKFDKIWKFVRIIYFIAIIIYLSFIIAGFYRFADYNKTQKAVDFINSKKITLFDVFGNNLPPKPDQNLNDSTVAGIDANNNFIRDDVELAIFAKYPNSAKIRAAMLQYAQALQLELTQVFDSKTLVATIQKEDLAYGCIGNASTEKSLDAVNKREKEIKDIVLNTDLRNKMQSNNSKKYMTTYSLLSSQECDINLSSLAN